MTVVTLRPCRRRGFTLVELLVASAILVIMFGLMANLTSQAGNWWMHGESQNQHRQRARATLDYMGAELKMALPPVDLTGTNGLQLVINPPAVSAPFKNHDSIFWQAPIATDTSAGDLAEIGYFVRWIDGAKPCLCRFFVNPSDTASYLIYSKPDSWITDDLLNLIAPGDKVDDHHYQGLFLENVIGFWATAYKADRTAYTNPSFDSRTEPEQKFPAYIELSLVLLDANAVLRLQAPGVADKVKQFCADSPSAEALIATLRNAMKTAPELTQIANTATIVRVTVNLDNYRQ